MITDASCDRTAARNDDTDREEVVDDELVLSAELLDLDAAADVELADICGEMFFFGGGSTAADDKKGFRKVSYIRCTCTNT